MVRLHNLDYLRGLAALGIMIFHTLSWSIGEFASDTFLGRIGIYGVSIFYVLSGLTLFYVYEQRMVPTLADVGDFMRKRFFRIFPLLWLACICTLVMSRKLPDFGILFLNLTGLFGLLKWDGYISTGAWSIGNELVFYLFFPFFVLLVKRSIPLFIVFSLLLFGIYAYFAFVVLNGARPLAEQWRDYVNPLNQVFLFLSGFLIGWVGKRINVSTPLNLLLLFSGVALFIFYPAAGDAAHLVTGVNRLVFTLICIVVCFSFYKLKVEMPPVIDRPLAVLGEISYSVYLLHPIVYAVVNFVLLRFQGIEMLQGWPVKFGITLVVTLFASYLTYHYVEKYFMKFGKRRAPVPQSVG